MKALKLTDVWRGIRNNKPGFTFNYASGQARLDRIYTQQTVEFVDIFAHTLRFGDHSELVAVIKNNTSHSQPHRARKPAGLWKLNSGILNEAAYETLIKDFINETSQYPARFINVGHWWEKIFKPGLKRITTSFCKKRANDQRMMRQALQRQLDEVVNAPSLDWAHYTDLKRRFLVWERTTLKGFEIRSRVEGSPEEKLSLFHIQKTSHNGRASLMTRLETYDNRTLTRDLDITTEIVDHFNRIFNNQPTPNHSLENFYLEGAKGIASNRNTNGSSQQ